MPTAIVTGCSRPTGFGQLISKTLAKAGFDVFATMRNAERGAELIDWATAQGVSLKVVEHDVTNRDQNRAAIEKTLRATGRLDVLVNNVGVSSFGALETLHNEHLRSVMETNFFAAVDLTRAVLPAMRVNGGGRILFVTSMAGVTGIPGESIYCASKFALEGLAESLAMETARFNIQISTIQPAFFNTGMSAHNTDATGFFKAGTVYDAFNERVVASTSQGELAGEDPQRVADTVLEAATTSEPKLRYYPGEAAPQIRQARASMSDEEWRGYLMSELGMSDWLEQETVEV